MFLPPEVAERLSQLGMDLFAVQAALFARGLTMPRPLSAASTPMARSAADIHPVVVGGPGQKIAYLPLWGGGSFTVTRRVIGI